MRKIDLIVIHCSATRADRDFTEEDLEGCHRRPADTRTEWQIHSMNVLILTLLRDYPGCRICGHRDLSPDLNGNGEIEPEEWVKACPCFDVTKEWR